MKAKLKEGHMRRVPKIRELWIGASMFIEKRAFRADGSLDPEYSWVANPYDYYARITKTKEGYDIILRAE